MTNDRAKAIVAIFGGNDPGAVALASRLGAEVATREQIVLTGGSAPGSKSVKEAALAGAGQSAWIGVERAETIGATATDDCCVVHTTLGHKRNFLEACLCDSAIVLEGGAGTISELLFSLALSRPVAIVGDNWTVQGALGDPTQCDVIDTMIERAFKRVGKDSSGMPDFDEQFNERVIRVGLHALPEYKHFSSSTAPERIVGWLLDVLKAAGKRGNFPNIERYRQVKLEYDRWLAKHAG
jgi:SLOG-like protein